jgi:hypothetical protein
MQRQNLTNIAELARWRQACIECRARFQSILFATNELYTLQDQQLALQPSDETSFRDLDFKLNMATDRVRMARHDLSSHLEFSHGVARKSVQSGVHAGS